MQLVKANIPLEPCIISGQLPFHHVLYPQQSLDAKTLHQSYLDALVRLSLMDEDGRESAACLPYNILLTARWMLVLPRSQNNIEKVFANALNYSGRFLVKRPEQLAWLKQYGLFRYLTECSVG
ncbi:hypothetical protein [Photobacterium atrarenae]|uniref:ATP adenylyltransferase C-terminal domain-containing protein n=1 Tax=Photobacterium atrarenae TaxID=865757 RepID=A0ABY5GJ04_9GAMM|nr:hypothetical protein [Photobacterium atrarenae]UTV29285.1 hypothetical protein NNL38_09665 [Photobacterium atrarenae]